MWIDKKKDVAKIKDVAGSTNSIVQILLVSMIH